MNYQEEYALEAIEALEPYLFLLPSDVQRKVKLAAAVFANHGCAPVEAFRQEVGGTNWVIAKRTKRIIERYGEDVITLTPHQYKAAERRAIETLVPAVRPCRPARVRARGLFTIFDCTTGRRVSKRSYATAEEASHDYYMNAGHTCVGPVSERTRRQWGMKIPAKPRVCASCGKLEKITIHGDGLEFTDFARHSPVHMDCL